MVLEMGDKIRNTVFEVLESSEMKEYLESMLRRQTDEITKVIVDSCAIRQADELRIEKEKNASLYQEKRLLEDEKREEHGQREEYQRKCEKLTESCKHMEEKLSLSEKQRSKIEYELGREKEKCNSVQKELVNITNEYETKLSSICEKLYRYESRYLKIEEAFLIYLELSYEMRIRLKNIFGMDNIYTFVAAVLEWNNIEGIWNFTKRRLIENEDRDAECLVNLFDFMFEAYCDCLDMHTFEVISPDVGQKYDSDKHSIIGTKTDGIISEVLLDGVYNVTDKRVIFKSIVKVL